LASIVGYMYVAFHEPPPNAYQNQNDTTHDTHLDVGVGLADVILVGEVGDLLEVDGQDGHGGQ
jgi:hypothetical protein